MLDYDTDFLWAKQPSLKIRECRAVILFIYSYESPLKSSARPGAMGLRKLTQTDSRVWGPGSLCGGKSIPLADRVPAAGDAPLVSY